jgi:arginine decarboxylase
VDELSRPLVDALRRSQQQERRSFHMPGHKGVAGALDEVLGVGISAADVSEMDGWFPYLHAPTTELAEAQSLAAARWGADATFFLVNGSTVGNLGAVLACVSEGDELLMCRGSHRSVYAGLSLTGASPVYLQPAHHERLNGEFTVSVEDASVLLDAHPNVRAIHLTRPNYYGMCTDIEAFASLARHRNIPLIVDEAHGAHFGLHPELPRSAMSAGADVVIQSTHKTLGALTQASMLHLRRGLVDERRLAQQLQTLQSSSPSVLLSMSLDVARAAATDEQLARVVGLAHRARRELHAVGGLRVLDGELIGHGGVVAVDVTKIVIDVQHLGRNGFAVAQELRAEHGIGVELADGQRIVCSITVGDTEESVNDLTKALRALTRSGAENGLPIPSLVPPHLALTIRAAEHQRATAVPLSESTDRVCAEYVIPYPPGIPLVAPGELLTATVLAALERFRQAGSRIVGPSDPALETIAVITPGSIQSLHATAEATGY